MTRLSLLVVATLLLVACADPVTAPEAGETGARPDGAAAEDDPARGGATQERTVPDEPGAPPEGPRTDAAPDELPPPASCPDAVAAAVGATIDAQLAAFARGDFPAALAEASPGFQASTDPATFRALIERDYPLLLEDASAEVEGCAQLRPELSDVVAVIATSDGTRTRFVYRLRLVEDRWGIEAAARLDPPPATA
jgi:hypothetical protein